MRDDAQTQPDADAEAKIDTAPDAAEAANPSDSSESPAGENGGMGAIFSDPARRRSDMRMIERAIRREWEIPPALYAALPGELIRLLAAGSKASNRDRLRAVQLVMAMHRDNITLIEAQKQHGGPQEGVTPEALVRAMLELTAPPPGDSPPSGEPPDAAPTPPPAPVPAEM